MDKRFCESINCQAVDCDNVEERAFTRPDGSEGWTEHKCVSLFGHKECLLKLRALDALEKLEAIARQKVGMVG